jgi:hypothetical protein
MNIKLASITVFTVVLLSGCETLKEMKSDYNQKLLNRAKDTCITYGFKEGTDSFSHCIQKEINEYKNRDAIKSATQKNNDK